MNETYLAKHRDADSFEFTCKSCNPEIIISLSGGLVCNLDALIKDNERKVAWIKESVKNSKAPVYSIVEYNLR
jgi:hypothetical protein